MNEKELFFKENYIPLLKKMVGNEIGAWGVLSAQGMIEHMTDSIGNAYGRIKLPLQTSEAILPKMRTFALGDVPFKENTKNALMNATPAKLRTASMNDAVVEIEHEIEMFIEFYKNNPNHTEMNPFFGEFNYNEWLHLLHKHATHHLKQFNLI